MAALEMPDVRTLGWKGLDHQRVRAGGVSVADRNLHLLTGTWQDGQVMPASASGVLSW